VCIVDTTPFEDDRGRFLRAYCAREFGDSGLGTTWVQANLSENPRRGTLRGMHFQREPASEIKFVRCVRGSLYDVVVDVRPDSPTRHQWFGVELSAENGRALYIPEGIAHGFLTLTDDTAAYYMVSAFYTPGVEGGLRWDDPAIGIEWPTEPASLSEKDASWPLIGESST
jgi:dTDP-4-dehydrorhamnose 3,5-epimerase